MQASQQFIDPSKRVITAVVPAPTGCNMKCAVCAIDRFDPAGEIALTKVDYERFATHLFDNADADRIEIVGHEPLLPESWGTTLSLLDIAHVRGKDLAIITNGWYLAERAKELASRGTFVSVSLDSSNPEEHDRSRRTLGAFEKALQGATAFRKCSEQIIALTFVLPQKRERLVGLPKVLADVGISFWFISPYLDKDGDPIEENSSFLASVRSVLDEAEKAGVQIIIGGSHTIGAENELSGLGVFWFSPDLEWYLRLTPSGACPFGINVTKPITDETPIWTPDVVPSEFVRTHAPKFKMPRA